MCEDIGSHADAHHKTSMMKAALDNKKDKITWPIAASQTSFWDWPDKQTNGIMAVL